MKITVHAVVVLMLLFTTMVSTSPVITTEQPSPKLLACLEQCKEENLTCIRNFPSSPACKRFNRDCLVLCNLWN
ncbi:hypothetical protein LSAT2_025205 [Lamellibrachia satsuma]|nr:hypothetical protein LSAT2_025205 [Lamellibrachia satsuma]